MPTSSRQTIRIGHSPDPDDAFMWYPLANFPNGAGPGGKTYTPAIDTGPYDFVHVLEDIQSLNERSERGELEITAISIHQYPFVADKYALTSCGSSMGDGYGPMVVARAESTFTTADLDRVRIAIPGERTTAFLALSLLLGHRPKNYQFVMFDQIIPRVVSGEFDAGLIIHEGQLTYGDAGLRCVADLGKWWTDTRKLPLPLGGNAIRRDLGAAKMREICTILLRSIEYALAHRDEAVQYALNYARDMGKDLADQFVGMYVNKWTLDYGERGRAAVKQLIGEAVKAGLVPDKGAVDFVEPE
jgi:1,4-dihydroxy-6-naphthoate synthase